MDSIESNFVPYQIALDMESLGFNEPCFKYWNITPFVKKQELFGKDGYYYNYPTNKKLSAPLYQQAFDFFEEKYLLSGEIQKQAPYQNVTKPYWWYMIQDGKGEDLSDWQSRFSEILDKSHQNIEGNFVDDDKFVKFLYDDKFAFETRNKAKLECLKKLIEITKHK